MDWPDESPVSWFQRKTSFGQFWAWNIDREDMGNTDMIEGEKKGWNGVRWKITHSCNLADLALAEQDH